MYVYFIVVGDYEAVKIGTAKDVEHRSSQLQTGNHKKLTVIRKIKCKSVKNAYHFEGELQRKHKEYNISGEWFHPIVILKGEFEGEEFDNIRHRAKKAVKRNQAIKVKTKSIYKKIPV